MKMHLEDGMVELQLAPGSRKAELSVDSGNELINAVPLSPAELHQLAYHALQLANEIRSVRGRG